MRRLRIGTRGSKLALWQAEHLRGRLLGDAKVESELVIIKTAGDQFSAAIPEIGGKGIFIKEIEEAILAGRVDLAVHSMKDVPTDFSTGCKISVVFKREDPRDCLLSRDGKSLAKLRHNARVGTSSVRRASQLKHFRPDLGVAPLRGNVDTRLRKLDAGEYDAIVLARAGIDRLELSPRITEVLLPEVMLPAPGQGALGIEFLEANEGLYNPFLIPLEDEYTVCSVVCERALQEALQGGCTIPLGAWARKEGDKMNVEACVLSPDGSDSVRRSLSEPCRTRADAQSLGRRLANELLDAGAGRLLSLARGSTVGD